MENAEGIAIEDLAARFADRVPPVRDASKIDQGVRDELRALRVEVAERRGASGVTRTWIERVLLVLGGGLAAKLLEVLG